MRVPPKWAQDLTLNALLWWEAQGNIAPSFNLEWARRTAKLSCGESYGLYKKFANPKIIIRQGKNKQDAKLVLLHEITHQLADSGHTLKFWSIAWQLYRWAKLPIRYCQTREYGYKAMAQVAYRQNIEDNK